VAKSLLSKRREDENGIRNNLIAAFPEEVGTDGKYNSIYTQSRRKNKF
jgi:hypothetical protein